MIMGYLIFVLSCSIKVLKLDYGHHIFGLEATAWTLIILSTIFLVPVTLLFGF